MSENDLNKAEVAAALAAVRAFLEAESVEEKAPPAKKSAWSQASITEQCQKARICSPSDLGKRLPLILALFLTVLPPANALERIQMPESAEDSSCSKSVSQFLRRGPASQTAEQASDEADGDDEAELEDEQGQPVQPLTELQVPPAQHNFHSKIRVAITATSDLAELAMPDGAEVFDELTGKRVAQLPPASYWQLKANGGNLAFAGQLTNQAFTRVVVAAKPASAYKRASYSHGAKRSSGQRVLVLRGLSPHFSLPIHKLPPVQPDQLREVQNIQTEQHMRPVAWIQSVATAAPQTLQAPRVLPARPLPGYLVRPGKSDGILSCAGKAYRGCFVVRPSADEQLQVLNVLDMEDYLLSVVPSEMPAGWPAEALKAQSIAARSYAVANIGKHGQEGYDVKATTEDQVYLGIQTETQASNDAVFETQGLVLKHNGKAISAFFHSSGGGCTETAEHVFNRGVPYLKAVQDYDHQSPHFSWQRTFPVSAIEEALLKQGKDIGDLLAIMPLSRAPSQRVKEVMLAGTRSTTVVSGEELRRIFTLPSTLFNVAASGDAYTIDGKGFGHGLGMSQWGAKFLAEQGYNAGQILAYYYKDVALEPAKD